jgi:hypothetical protein
VILGALCLPAMLRLAMAVDVFANDVCGVIPEEQSDQIMDHRPDLGADAICRASE